MTCERPKCTRDTTSDLRYCSDTCYDLDNDPNPITVRGRYNTRPSTFTEYCRQPVIISDRTHPARRTK